MRDRNGEGSGRIRFSSAILGPDAPTSRPAAEWERDHDAWRRRAARGLSASGPGCGRAPVDLKSRGLAEAPRLTVGDGGPGFRRAADELFPETRHQRCRVHKTANVKSDLNDIQHAPGRAEAEAATERFPDRHGEVLPAFMDFPAGHWKRPGTANPIESLFATVRHRTVRTGGCLSWRTAKVMVFTLARAAERRWNPLEGSLSVPGEYFSIVQKQKSPVSGLTD